MAVKPSIPGHGFEVGDMVWAKMKSQPWWPGHVYSEEFATPLVRRSKREGLLLVAFFGVSSYGWFDSSELIPFDSNYAEKSLQTDSRTFVRAVEDAMDEVCRRSGLGLSCMCRNKQNFGKIDVEGFFSVDVAGYDPGAIYSIDAIRKARDGFQPKLTLDFLRHLALEPTLSEHVDIYFIKTKATIMSYRKAVYEDVDEAFGYDSVHTSIQELAPREMSSKVPLSGREVFADSLRKVKNTAKLKDYAKKDEYLFKWKDEPKESKKEKEKVASSPLSVPFKDLTIAAGELTLKDGTGSLEDKLPTVSCFEIMTSIVESPTSSSVAEDDEAKVRLVDDEKRIVQEGERKIIAQDDFTSPGPHKIAAFRPVVSGPEKKKIPKRSGGELGSGKSLVEKVSAKKTGRPDGPQRSDGNYEMEFSQVLDDLLSLAVDPFNIVNRGSRIKGKRTCLRFRSLVFQKSKSFLVPLACGESNAGKSTEDGVEVPPVKPHGGLKRRPPDPQEEMVVAKRKNIGDIRNLTNEKTVIKKIDECPARDVKQPIAMTFKKAGPEFINKTEQQAPTPTMLVMQFPQGGSLPSGSELKERFAHYGPIDHSATQVFRNTFSCRVVFRHKAHARAAYGFVVGSSGLFGNADVKCILKEVGDVGAAEPELPVKVPKEEHHQPAIVDRSPSTVPSTSGVQLKSIAKISGGEEVSGNAGREVFADSLGKVMNTAKPEDHAKKEDTDLSRIFDDLRSLAVDPFSTVNRRSHIKGKKAFLKFRSLVFQKSQNFSRSLAAGEPNASKSPEDSVEAPPVKPQGGLKRVPPDPPEETTVAKRKKVGDIRNLTMEKKVMKKIDEPPARDVKQSVATASKKLGSGIIKKSKKRAPRPTMLMIKFPQGGCLPSINELKTRFAPYGPMDHSGTHIFWNTFSCQVVFRHKEHAQAAFKFVVGSSSLFGNTSVKCRLKEVGIMGSAEPEPSVNVPKQDQQRLDIESRPSTSMIPATSGVQLKSILKKSGGEEAVGNGGSGRVMFMSGGENRMENSIENKSDATSFSSRLTMDFSKDIQNAAHPSVVTSTPLPPIHDGLPPLSPLSMQMTPLRVVNRTPHAPSRTRNMDITQQMLSLLTRCHDVVTNISSILGYTPYHPL